MTSPIRSEPLRRADDRVVADLAELRLNLDPALAPLLDLELQDLTGLIRAPSRRRSFPPEMPVRDPAPLGVVCKKRRKRLGVALIESFGGRAQLIDHAVSMAPLPPLSWKARQQSRSCSSPGALRAQLLGHIDAQIPKRIDIAAAALYNGMQVDALNDLDLSYTRPFGSPWDAVQSGARAWSHAKAATGTRTLG